MSFPFLIEGAFGTPSLLFFRHCSPHSMVLLLITRVMASILPVDKQPVHIAPDSLQDLQLQVGLLLVAALHPVFKGGQFVVRFLMRLSVRRHLVTGEVLPGVVVPGGRRLNCIVMELAVHEFEYCLESEHDIQQDFAVMPRNATVLEGRSFILPKLHKCQEIMPPLQTSHRYIVS